MPAPWQRCMRGSPRESFAQSSRVRSKILQGYNFAASKEPFE